MQVECKVTWCVVTWRWWLRPHVLDFFFLKLWFKSQFFSTLFDPSVDRVVSSIFGWFRPNTRKISSRNSPFAGFNPKNTPEKWMAKEPNKPWRFGDSYWKTTISRGLCYFPCRLIFSWNPWQLKVHGFYAPGISLHRSFWSKVDRGIFFGQRWGNRWRVKSWMIEILKQTLI